MHGLIILWQQIELFFPIPRLLGVSVYNRAADLLPLSFQYTAALPSSPPPKQSTCLHSTTEEDREGEEGVQEEDRSGKRAPLQSWALQSPLATGDRQGPAAPALQGSSWTSC